VGDRAGALEALGLSTFDPRPNSAFWKRRKVWLSGHTGFKGAWLSWWLRQLGAEVFGHSLLPPTDPSLFGLLALEQQMDHRIADIRDPASTQKSIRDFQPEIVFHLAAQSLVRPGYEDPLGTFGSNVMGTAHVLDAVRQNETARVVVCVTTDKVYRNPESGRPFREEDPLGGRDPYSASKAGAEMVVACYRDSFLTPRGVAVAAARAGNVIGGGDWSRDRLLPDAVRAWGKGKMLTVRNPEATRPWQHVLEPLAAYLRLAENLFQKPSLAGDYNFGPPPDQRTTVRQVVEMARKAFGSGEIRWGKTAGEPHEAKTLSLDTGKAAQVLGIQPVWTPEEAVERAMTWYRRHRQGESPATLCQENLEAFLVAR